MTNKQFLEELAKDFKIIVRTEYHVQIEVREHFYHDIWLGKDGIKIRFAGQRRVELIYSFDRLKNQLSNYNYGETDHANMILLQGLIQEIKVRNKQGIHVDAGYKEGKAKIAIIRVNGEELDVFVRMIPASDSGFAESKAVEMAIQQYPDDTPIFTDSQGVAEKYGGRVKWIPRNLNKVADKFGNMRQKKQTTVVKIDGRKNFDVYIGRATTNEDGYFGNPHPIGYCSICESIHGRESAMVKYKEYFDQRIKDDAIFRDRILSLKGKKLGCFCKPLACHGDIIADWLEELS